MAKKSKPVKGEKVFLEMEALFAFRALTRL
jgi:hypothetical protein